MKIGQVTLLQRKNLGDYQHLEVSISAVVEDEETASTAIDKLRKLVKWHLNADEWNAKYKKLSAQAEHTEAETAWIKGYHETLAEVVNI